jgi:hypothetical protein
MCWDFKKYCFVLSFILTFSAIAAETDQWTTEAYNTLSKTGEDCNNPNYNKRIKNIIIFQAGGWSGLLTEDDANTKKPTWPLRGGKKAYIVKNEKVYLEQLEEVRNLSGNLAIAVLLMPDEEAKASGYGAYFNGEWKSPKQLYAHVKRAAWMKGVMTCPHISINNYGTPADGNTMMNKFKAYIDWFRTTVDNATLKNKYGKPIVLTEGLPENTNCTKEQKYAIQDYMNAQKDLVFLDNLAFEKDAARAAANVYRCAATCTADGQDYLVPIWGSKYRWHYINRYGYFKDKLGYIPAETQDKWLNIKPAMGCPWPVVISQWNEYAEYLVFEPSLMDRHDLYNNLKAKFALQP